MTQDQENRFYINHDDPTGVLSFLRSALTGAADLQALCQELRGMESGCDRDDELGKALPSICAIAADAVRFLEERLVREPAADQAPPARGIAA